jgi:hypothetical protein
MRSLSGLFLIWCAVCCQAQTKELRLTLPKGAEVHIGSNGSDNSNRPSNVCPTSQLTEKQIRWRFQTYSYSDGFTEAEREDYDRSRPCWTNGSITLDGRSYTYQVRLPDILFTNFPDGKEKLLQGGLKGDDPPSRSVRLTPKPMHFPLPADAQINLGKSSSETPNEDCSYFRFSAEAIRRRFQTYHVLVGDEFHNSYGVYPCRFNGSVVVRGRTYTFEARQGNLLVTDFPNGEGKMLGGTPSDPLNDSIPVRLDPDVSHTPKLKGK